ncbi:MAG: hypothetical protein ACLFQK_07575 [Fibrobacterota bacterium]
MILKVLLAVILFCPAAFSQTDSEIKEEAEDIMEKRSPDAADGTRGLAGEIVFKEAFVIEGKVEKPLVTIFLPKEKIKIGAFDFEKSFMPDLLESPSINTYSAVEGDGAGVKEEETIPE